MNNVCTVCLDETAERVFPFRCRCTVYFHQQCLSLYLNSGFRACPFCRETAKPMIPIQPYRKLTFFWAFHIFVANILNVLFLAYINFYYSPFFSCLWDTAVSVQSVLYTAILCLYIRSNSVDDLYRTLMACLHNSQSILSYILLLCEEKRFRDELLLLNGYLTLNYMTLDILDL